MYHKHKHFKKDIKKLKKMPNPGIQGKLSTLKINEDDAEVVPDDLDDFIEGDDYGEFESDFMKVGDMHKMHEKEVVEAKNKLINRIVKSKYVDEVEPSFLTFAEKIEIQTLYKNDPTIWTPERLSESFPALPHTIKKVIKSSWIPRSVDRVLKYDQNVIDNWIKYQTGEIALSPMLNKHLEKFKHRNIIVTDRETIAKYIIAPEIVFPSPKSKLFSNIIKSYISSTEHEGYPQNKEYLESIKHEKSWKAEQNSYEDSNFKQEQNLNLYSQKMTDCEDVKPIILQSNCEIVKNKCKGEEPQTFTDFLKDNVAKTLHKMTPEAIVMRDVYQKHIDKDKESKSSINSAVPAITTNEGKEIESTDTCDKLEILVEKESLDSNIQNPMDSKLDTYVKVWIKKDEEDCNYSLCIKIPKGKYKKGMTYRVKDCYYDDDGTFLYRVPALKS